MTNTYALLDSGDGQRLEQFGNRILARPSSLAVWKQRVPELWNRVSATYDHDAGWTFGAETFESWTLPINGLTLSLRLQRNGQIGFFPEHTLYLEGITESVKKRSCPSVLNLFAYTGMASAAAVIAGANVTHVDNLKTVLDWAGANAELNSLKKESLRLIPEEAVTYLEREVKRGKRHDIVIMDPPGFSRVSKGKSWDLVEILPQLLRLAVTILKPSGELFFTAHGAESGATTVENLLLDLAPNALLHSRELALKERDSQRHLSAGYLVHATLQ